MPERTKLLIVSSEFPPKIGGAGSYIYDIVKNIDTSKYNITLVIRKFSNDKIMFNGIKVIEVNNTPKIFILNMWRKIKYLNLEKFDKIILNDIGASIIGSIFFKKSLQIKAICILHGGEPEVIFLENKILYKVIKFKKKYIDLLKNSSDIIAVSNDMKNKFLEITKLYELKNKIKVITNGVDMNIFHYSEFDIHKNLNIEPEKKIILTVSRMTQKKGFDIKLNILENLYNISPNFQWVIVGNGDYLNVFKNKINKSVISKNVTFIGKMPRNKLKYYYSSADLFVLLSEFRESFGLVYLEANACGCPAMGLDYGGVSEVICTENGILIDKKDILNTHTKIYDLFQNNKFSKDTIINYAKENNIQNNLKKLDDLLLKNKI